MMILESMLIDAAGKAGMKVPPDADEFDAAEFPHFRVFCNLQLCRPMKMDGEHFRNAEVIAQIPEERIKTMKLADFLAEGLEYQT
jgi:hypothetical protein